MLSGEIHTAILSRNKEVKSSSTFASKWVPSRVVDVDLRTDADDCNCCSATLNQLEPWFELDIGKSYKIHQIDVYGRTKWDLINRSYYFH